MAFFEKQFSIQNFVRIKMNQRKYLSENRFIRFENKTRKSPLSINYKIILQIVFNDSYSLPYQYFLSIFRFTIKKLDRLFLRLNFPTLKKAFIQ